MGSESRYIICPFYRSGGQHYVNCEGIEGTKVTSLHFGSAPAKNAYKVRCCENARHYTECEIFRAVAKKYNRAEAEKPREKLIIL